MPYLHHLQHQTGVPISAGGIAHWASLTDDGAIQETLKQYYLHLSLTPEASTAMEYEYLLAQQQGASSTVAQQAAITKPPADPISGGANGRQTVWPWITGGIIVVGIIAFLLWPKNSEVTVAETPATADTVAAPPTATAKPSGAMNAEQRMPAKREDNHKPPPQPVKPAITETTAAALTNEEVKSIVLRHYAASEGGSVEEALQFYAPRVERYYHYPDPSHNLPSPTLEVIRKDIERSRAHYSERRADISADGISVQPMNDGGFLVNASFDYYYTIISRAEPHKHHVSSQLILDSNGKIVSQVERENNKIY